MLLIIYLRNQLYQFGGREDLTLKLVAVFLEDRCMKVKYKGKYSNIFNLPGGPQSHYQWCWICWAENQHRRVVTAKKKVMDMNTMPPKYVDDLALAQSIDMTSQLGPWAWYSSAPACFNFLTVYPHLVML